MPFTDNGFDRACPSGNTLIDGYGFEDFTSPQTAKCERCKGDDEKHVCNYCLTEIDAQECEEYDGSCALCAESIRELDRK